MRKISFLGWILLGLASSIMSADAAGSRVALLIGNSAYQNVPPLPNPINDATDLSVALKRLDFDVRTVTNARYDDMRRALIEFVQQARGAEIAVIFFAGHGMEVGGENWIIPIDAQLATDLNVSNEAMGLQSLMRAVSGATKLGIVILDACRNNPFVPKMQTANLSRDVERGFSRVEPTDNVLVAYAARDGTTASDGAERNSPFTRSLLKNIETPGLEVRFLFAKIRDDVMAATKRQQQPALYASLSSEQIFLKAPFSPSLSVLSPGSAPSLNTGPSEPAAVQGDQSTSVGRVWVGLRIQRVSDDVAQALKLNAARGALIAGIDEKGPARLAGLLPGDVLIKFDGKDIDDFMDYPRALLSTPVGKTVELVVIRNSREQTVKLTAARAADELKPVVPAANSSDDLGLKVTAIDSDTRARYSLRPSIKGAVVTAVQPGSAGDEARIREGEVIIEVSQEAVSGADEFSARVQKIKARGNKTALLLLSNKEGELRFVAANLR